MKRLLIFLVALLMLGACATLPNDGKPQAVDRPAQTGGDVVLDPQGPNPGASPEEVVMGFLQASAAGLSDDFAVARQYLTSEAATSWNPNTQIRIYSDSETISTSQMPSGSFRVSVGAAGVLDSDGRYASSQVDSLISSELSLMKDQSGEWRIAVLDDGIMMPDSLFQSFFQESPVYYLTQDLAALVPDVHWYPRSTAAPMLIRGLVAGPPSWLGGAVRSMLPQGATVVDPVVTMEGSLAVVNFSAEVSQLSPTELNMLYAQVRQSLTSIPAITDVQIRANGVEMTPNSALELQSYPFGAYSVHGLVSGQPAFLSDDGPVMQAESQGIRALDLTDLALPYEDSASKAFALGSKGRSIYAIDYSTEAAKILFTGENLVSPSTDSYNWIWTAESDGSSGLQIRNFESDEVVNLRPEWLNNLPIRDIQVSREGARVAITVERQEGYQLLLAGVVRDANGKPLAIGEPNRYGRRLADVMDVAWISASDLVVIGLNGLSTEPILYRVSLGGPDEVLNSLEGMEKISAGRGLDSVILQTVDKDVYLYEGGAWRQIAHGVVSPVYPG